MFYHVLGFGSAAAHQILASTNCVALPDAAPCKPTNSSFGGMAIGCDHSVCSESVAARLGAQKSRRFTV
jgi:hypothetical protein